jgi:hypothetical protein
MIAEGVRLVLVVGLLIVLPGWLLVNAVFPRRTFRGIERAYVVVATGILELMLVATALGFLPHGSGSGWYSTFATGFPSVELAALAACIVLFWIGLVRGAYPKVQARYPRLVAPEAKDPEGSP